MLRDMDICCRANNRNVDHEDQPAIINGKAVEATVVLTEGAHNSSARKPFALMAMIAVAHAHFPNRNVKPARGRVALNAPPPKQAFLTEGREKLACHFALEPLICLPHFLQDVVLNLSTHCSVPQLPHLTFSSAIWSLP
jgi:hypothetical protein